MEEEKVKKEPKLYLNYGIITGLILIVLFVLYYVFGLYTNTKMAWVPSLIFVALIIYTQIKYAKSLDGNITYGNLFAAGFKAACAATAIYLVFLIIFLLLVPSYKDSVLEAQRQMMASKGMTDAQIDAGMGFAKKSFNVFAIGGGLLGNLIVGVIAALIGAAVAKKNPQPQLNRL